MGADASEQKLIEFDAQEKKATEVVETKMRDLDNAIDQMTSEEFGGYVVEKIYEMHDELDTDHIKNSAIWDFGPYAQKLLVEKYSGNEKFIKVINDAYEHNKYIHHQQAIGNKIAIYAEEELKINPDYKSPFKYEMQISQLRRGVFQGNAEVIKKYELLKKEYNKMQEINNFKYQEVGKRFGVQMDGEHVRDDYQIKEILNKEEADELIDFIYQEEYSVYTMAQKYVEKREGSRSEKGEICHKIGNGINGLNSRIKMHIKK